MQGQGGLGVGAGRPGTGHVIPRDSGNWMQYKLARDTAQHASDLTDNMNRWSKVTASIFNVNVCPALDIYRATDVPMPGQGLPGRGRGSM